MQQETEDVKKLERLWETFGVGFAGSTNLELAMMNILLKGSEEDIELVKIALRVPENSNEKNKDQTELVELARFLFTEEGV